MKKFLISACALFSLMSSQAFAGDKPAEALLHQMSEASKNLSYELSYILIKRTALNLCCIVTRLTTKTSTHILCI